MEIKELISKINIVDLIANFSTITKSGSSYKTLCNVHGDKTPSLSISPRRQMYKCFVCDHGGNALDYLIWAQKFTYQQAVEYIAKEAGEDISLYQTSKNTTIYTDNQQKIINVLEDATDLFKYYLDIYIQINEHVQNFFKKRNLTQSEIKKYFIGFAPNYSDDNYVDLLNKKAHSKSLLINSSLINEETEKPFFTNRVIFPIFDDNGKIVALSGRKISNDNSPKYLNSKESLVFKKSSIIYNYHNAKHFEQIIIVEGFMDVIAFNKIGYDNAVAIMGTSLTIEHINKIKKHKEVLIFLDSDKAGINSTLKIIELFLKHNINSFILENKFSKDADEIVNSVDGKNNLLSILNNKIRLIDFAYNHFILNLNKKDPSSIKDIVSKLNIFTKYLDDIDLFKLASDFAKLIEIDLQIVLRMFKFKMNVIKSNWELEKNNNKEDLEEKKELVNINKILLTLFMNPSYLQINQLNEIVWFNAKYKNIFNEIKGFHENNKQLTELSKNYLQELKNKYSIQYALPQSENEFVELIKRSKEYDIYISNSQLTTDIINSSSVSEKEKLIYLKNLQKMNEKKIKE